MIKYIVLIGLLLLSFGCVSETEETEGISPSDGDCDVIWDFSLTSGVTRCYDAELDTHCYLYKAGYAGGISCIKGD